MSIRQALVLTVLLLILPMRTIAADSDVSRRSPGDVVQQLIAWVVTDPADTVAAWLTPAAGTALSRIKAQEQQSHTLAKLGPVLATAITTRTETAAGTALTVTVTHWAGISRWTFTFRDKDGLIDDIRVDQAATPTVEASDPNPPRPKRGGPRRPAQFQPATGDDTDVSGSDSGGPSSAPPHHRYSHSYSMAARRPAWQSAKPPAADENVPPPPPEPVDVNAPPQPVVVSAEVPAPQDPAATDARTVDFLLATTRVAQAADGRVSFLPDRSPTMQYGAVRVHVPDQDNHVPGHVELPKKISLLGVTLYEEKLDEKKHFVIRYTKLLTPDQFYATVSGGSDKEALVFVHGFNNSFEDSAYRFAQILFDLQYKKPAVLFSWASKGSVADYVYDKDSAMLARDQFTALIRGLKARGIERINVIAHSMGNLVVIDALANSADTALPDRIDQLIMAAPDVGRDYFAAMEPKLAKVTEGMTLYACSTDRALTISKRVAGGVPRAGDVPVDGPIIIDGVDTIDVSALGQDWFGLNHDVFASNRSVIDDMFQLLNFGRHPPRLAQVRGMPDGLTPPSFWRFQP